MMNFIIGVVVGVVLASAAVNPNEAKNMTAKVVDSVHNVYNNGVSVNTAPSKPAEVSPEMKAAIAEELAKIKQ